MKNSGKSTKIDSQGPASMRDSLEAGKGQEAQSPSSKNNAL